MVPDPCRYAVHKLIVAGRRQNDAGGKAKKDKDLRQAGMLFEALQVTGEATNLAEALREAWDRGPSWRSRSWLALMRLPDNINVIHRIFGILPAMK